MAVAPAAAATNGTGVATVALAAEAQAVFSAAKAKPLPTLGVMRELFGRFDYNKNKVLSLAEIDKVLWTLSALKSDVVRPCARSCPSTPRTSKQ